MKIYKEPKFENDSYMFVIDTETDELELIPEKDQKYFANKYSMFQHKITSKRLMEPFVEGRPSLSAMHIQKDLSGSVYTYTCQSKNKLDYNHIIKYCKRFHKMSRRCAINFADTLHDYLQRDVNTSCLNSIHFCNDNVTLYFRASDIKNELLIDLHLINEFFIKPVGNFKTITVIASTAQNIETKLSTLIQ